MGFRVLRVSALFVTVCGRGLTKRVLDFRVNRISLSVGMVAWFTNPGMPSSVSL